MARITIEDCIEKVPNRFHLVQMTAIRAKQLKKGARPLVGNEENKEVVMALREIAEGLVTVEFTDESTADLEAELMNEVEVGEADGEGGRPIEELTEATAEPSDEESVPEA